MKHRYQSAFGLIAVLALAIPSTVLAAPDTMAPVVSMPSSGAATKSVPITLTATATDGNGVTGCSLYVNSSFAGVMTLTGTTSVTASKSYTFTSLGSNAIQISCHDAAGNNGYAYGTITVSNPSADTSAPVVSSLTPSTATVGSAVTVHAAVTDNVAVTNCYLYVDSVLQGTMAYSGTTSIDATRSYTFASAGTKSVMVRCVDAAGNAGTRTISVVASDPLIISPTPIAPTSAITSVTYTGPLSGTVGATTYFTSTYTGTTASTCRLYYTNVAGTTSYYLLVVMGMTAFNNTTTPPAGSYQMYVRCYDAAGVSRDSATFIFTANVSTPAPAPAVTDTVAPLVSGITPLSAIVGTSVMISANYSDSVGVVACELYIDGSDNGGMTRSTLTSGLASRSVTFSSAGNVMLEIRCSDAAGNQGTLTQAIAVLAAPAPPSVLVPTPSPAPAPSPSPSPSPSSSPSLTGTYARQLVKLRCPAGAAADHPCKAVYYIGSDGKRHAFPNERAYFTWYSNFDNVYELDSLSSYSLGMNVTYRPGIRLMKFTTVDRVYAVSRNGVLRWVTTEALARELYGDNWNRKVDDISDAFYTNYRFGSDITSSGSYVPSTETSGASSVDVNFGS